MGRIAARFAALKQQGRAGLVTFVTAGDPDAQTSLAILKGLPAAGADLIELGMPFTDPMADGPAIQAASLRALQAGADLKKTLALVRAFREGDETTPIVLMGYFNPIYAYGAQAFARDAAAAGVDGLIVVDLPPEEAEELCGHTRPAGLDFIVLTTPTTDEKRLPAVLVNASGFVYYVSILGITGTRSADGSAVADAVKRIRRQTDLPVAVGFGVKNAANVAEFAAHADAVVVGSAVVSRIADNIGKPGLVDAVLGFVRELASGVRGRH